MKQVLHGRDGTDTVAAFGDDLSWGPIGERSLEARIDYFDGLQLYPDRWDWLREVHEEFWTAVGEVHDYRLVWLGSNSPCEMAGYLAFLNRFPGLSAQVIRPDDYLPEHPKYGPAGSIGVLTPEQIADALDSAPRTEIDACLTDRWTELVADNALLRVIDHKGRLVSAPIDMHDHLILGAARPEWMRGVRLVGHALADGFDAGIRVHTDFLFSRMFHLVDTGALEADGDLRAWTKEHKRSEAQVRLPQGHA